MIKFGGNITYHCEAIEAGAIMLTLGSINTYYNALNCMRRNATGTRTVSQVSRHREHLLLADGAVVHRYTAELRLPLDHL
mmetsp:Transcript_56464/g.132442  ORF Transcript_56464/g.132442 Transcript_56464/m.132442 type:complete len:80 (+) Transcript_56464:2-241(+)